MEGGAPTVDAPTAAPSVAAPAPLTPSIISQRARGAERVLRRHLELALRLRSEESALIARLEGGLRTHRRAHETMSIAERIRGDDPTPASSTSENAKQSGPQPAAAAADAAAAPGGVSGVTGEQSKASADGRGAMDADDEPALSRAENSAGRSTSEADAGSPAGAEGDGPAGARRRPRLRIEDGVGKQRTRNMFGVLMGTLKRARDEVSASDQGAVQQQKMAAVDERLRSDRLAALDRALERTTARLETARTRHEALSVEVEALDVRARRLACLAHEAALANFLHTETAPRIYYRPAQHSDATRALLTRQQRAVLGGLEARLLELEPRRPDAAGEDMETAEAPGSPTAVLAATPAPGSAAPEAEEAEPDIADVHADASLEAMLGSTG
jgi:hypothetical protein